MLPCLATMSSMEMKQTRTASAKKQKSLERDWALENQAQQMHTYVHGSKKRAKKLYRKRKISKKKNHKYWKKRPSCQNVLFLKFSTPRLHKKENRNRINISSNNRQVSKNIFEMKRSRRNYCFSQYNCLLPHKDKNRIIK